MTSGIEALAPAVRQSLAEWHRFVATGSEEVLRPLFAENTVFRSPFVHSPIPGRPASLLILTTVVTIFENFRYHRTFVSGDRDVVLEFSATVAGKELKGRSAAGRDM